MTNHRFISSIMIREYVVLCKPRVVLLMLLTVFVGMLLATKTMIEPSLFLATLVGVGCTASAAATFNHILDKRIDSIMTRTKSRPVATGSISASHALIFAFFMGVLGLTILLFWVNQLTAILTFLTLIGYAGIYTGYLKRATPQNIVIGGLAGATPPLLGWCAVSNSIDPYALLLVLIIFIWTPPHFWALAIYRLEDYKNAEIPMLPVTHGVFLTKLHVLLYTILLLMVSLLPVCVGMSGWLYGIGALMLGIRFLYWAYQLFHQKESLIAMKTFRFSIIYLMFLFVLLIVDHFMILHQHSLSGISL